VERIVRGKEIEGASGGGLKGDRAALTGEGAIVLTYRTVLNAVFRITDFESCPVRRSVSTLVLRTIVASKELSSHLVWLRNTTDSSPKNTSRVHTMKVIPPRMYQ
jgi:hypothetical protein